MLNKNLLALLGKDKKKLFVITFFNVLSLILNVLITATICLMLYLSYIQNFRISSYALYISLCLVCLGLRVFLISKIGKIKSDLGSNVKLSFRKQITDKIYSLGLQNNKKTDSTLTQLVIEGIEQLSLYFTMFLPQFFFGMIAPVILFIICLFIKWQTALVLIICLPLIPISIIFVSRFAKKIFQKYWDKYISMGDGFLDSVNGMKELKIFDADKAKQTEIAEKSEEFRKITMKVLVMQLSSLTIIDMVAFAGAAIAISVTLSDAQSDASSVFQALFLILICAEFFLPMRALGSAFHIAMNGTTAGNTLVEFLEKKEKVSGDKKIDNINKIEFKNLDFSYNKNKLILNNINIEFKKGLNSIVGQSGSGKSTITSLLISTNSPNKGEILINNSNLKEFSLKSYYKKLAIVAMGTHIFNTSIRDNFKLANENVTDEEIFIALKKVNMYDFVLKVGGLDYIILEDSQNISGGQKQRLAFAVNTIMQKDLYIFDEPTSNIDSESEEIIMQNINALSQNNIVILISHRLKNVVASDKIFMLKDAIICESGTHKELMTLQGEYSKLYLEQDKLENSYKEVSNA
ncbi:MAG: ABC transporter ATP-binding protein/permease [Clostridia bacterium]